MLFEEIHSESTLLSSLAQDKKIKMDKGGQSLESYK